MLVLAGVQGCYHSRRARRSVGLSSTTTRSVGQRHLCHVMVLVVGGGMGVGVGNHDEAITTTTKQARQHGKKQARQHGKKQARQHGKRSADA